MSAMQINLSVIRPENIDFSGNYRCIICDIGYYHQDPGIYMEKSSTHEFCPECLQHFRDMIKREKIFKPLL